MHRIPLFTAKYCWLLAPDEFDFQRHWRIVLHLLRLFGRFVRLEELLLAIFHVVVEQHAGSSALCADGLSVSLQFELQLMTCLRTNLHLAADRILSHGLLRSGRRL